MYKNIFVFFACLMSVSAVRATDFPLESAHEIFEATKIVCSGISDEISKVSKISKVNTVVTTAGTVAAGGALAAGIAKKKI